MNYKNPCRLYGRDFLLDRERPGFYEGFIFVNLIQPKTWGAA